MPKTRVAVIAFEGASLFHLTVPQLVFGADLMTSGNVVYEISYCAVEPGMVRSDAGLEIRVEDGLDALTEAVIIIVPAWPDPETRAPDVLSEALSKAHANGKLIVGLCLGAFVLGDAGLLDDREATTHWMARDTFARRFHKTRFRPDVLYVEDRGIVTSAGNVAAIDCCLNIIREQHGADVANRVARILVTPPLRQGGQAQYVEKPVPQFPCQTRLPGVLEWAVEHLSESLDVDTMAAAACMSRRSFTRHFRDATGMSVTQWLNTQRVARAQQLLETTDLSIEHVADEAGFGTPLSLRHQFAAQLGTAPADYRKAFRAGSK
ncbi:helix-turn-helix domain-containing protein [Acetobacter lovaniensis]|jgi:transcriptional regulator GlxA family with amidase domain|uniref:GlxA family transcriptional regulator n=1 Tax=Acetobacter lovaniensis TaxID=104100 RepID=UPI00209ED6D3|nr:helix-turn-helix domain-containing protein [Acetobacter lovaniensis]MCP1240255.1 helix-turn-helix domain-containing protein [Acetobacter lovaniensis]